MKKAIIFALLGLVIGLAVGSLMTMVYIGHTTWQARYMFQTAILEMEDAALKAYHSQPNQVASYALENYIVALHHLDEELPRDNENLYGPLNLNELFAVAHTRAGQLFDKMGDYEKSLSHIREAKFYANRLENTDLGTFNTEEDLISFINNLRPKKYQIGNR